MTTARTVLTIAALTLREATRRRVLLALAVLTVVLIALSGWGFSRLAAESGGSALTSGEARLTASIVLNLVMFGFSLIAALGTAFLAGPTLSGETESGIALAVLARPDPSLRLPAGQVAGAGGVRQRLRRPRRAGPVPRRPGDGGLLAAAAGGRPRAARGADDRAAHPRPAALDGHLADGVGRGRRRPVLHTWVAGVVGGVGESLGNEAVARVGTVSRMLLPTDGLWQGAMHAFQDPSVFVTFGGADVEAFPFLSAAPLTATYLAWAAVWVAMVWALAATSFVRKDL